MRANPFCSANPSPKIEQELLSNFQKIRNKSNDWSDDLWEAYSQILAKYPEKEQEIHEAYVKISGILLEDRFEVVDNYRGVSVDIFTGKEEKI